jgi:signal transduction histidine kinase
VQALVILLDNALDATGSPRRVRLRAETARAGEGRLRKSEPPPAPFVRIDVKDDGPGIPPDILGRIFDPFFTTKATGTGLGLSIAQQLVTVNGARIELTSAIGGPTTFSVLVPIAGVDVAPLSRR